MSGSAPARHARRRPASEPAEALLDGELTDGPVTQRAGTAPLVGGSFAALGEALAHCNDLVAAADGEEDTVDLADPVPTGNFADIPPEQLRQIVLAYMPLVHQTVRELARRLPANVQRDDLLAAGVYGLVDSLRKNGGDQGASFRFYARTRIRGAIVDELRAQDWLSRRARDRVSAEAEAEGVSSAPAAFVSLDDLGGVEDQEFFAASDDPAAVAEARCECRALALAIAQLPERERRIVGRHYFDGMKFKDIGLELGVSEPRISQLHARALGLLRALLDKAA